MASNFTEGKTATKSIENGIKVIVTNSVLFLVVDVHRDISDEFVAFVLLAVLVTS